jgi:CAAX prenyl protease-like protein
MTTPAPSPPARVLKISDDAAYYLPMLVFLLLTSAGGTWPSLFPASYVVKTIAAAALLFVCRRHYTRISWSHWRLGAVVGVVGIVQWIGMEKLLPGYPRLSHGLFDPTKEIPDIRWRIAFEAVRWAGATLLVPVMEELFWRDFLWRTILAPNDFKLAAVGEWDWTAFLIVALAFAGVHSEWLTAIVYGLIIGGLLAYTRSLGACIVCHAVSNLLLGAYVLWTHDWELW